MNPEPEPPKVNPGTPWPRRWHILAYIAAGFIMFDIVATLCLRWYANTHGGPERFTAQTQIKGLATALGFYKFAHGGYPSQEEGLLALFKSTGFHADDETLDKRLRDPWGHHYQYRIPGKHHPESYDLFSLGEDGDEGTADDIGNW